MHVATVFRPTCTLESLLFEAVHIHLQGLTGIISNPVINNGVAGLATTATAFAGVEVGVRESALCHLPAQFLEFLTFLQSLIPLQLCLCCLQQCCCAHRFQPSTMCERSHSRLTEYWLSGVLVMINTSHSAVNKAAAAACCLPRDPIHAFLTPSLLTLQLPVLWLLILQASSTLAVILLMGERSLSEAPDAACQQGETMLCMHPWRHDLIRMLI